MEVLAEDELNDVYRRGASASGQAARNGFNLDDAFSDTEDNDVSFEFSPDALRKELAKNLPHDPQWGHHEDAARFSTGIGYTTDGADASVSTFDIDASHPLDQIESLSPPIQQPHSPDSQPNSHPSHPDSLNDIPLSSEFSSISLSSHHSPVEPNNDDPEDNYFSAYPSVHIDASEEHPIPQEVSVSTPPVPPDTDHDRTTTPSSRETESTADPESPPITPPSNASYASTSSIPIPSSSSLPTPTSAKSSTSTTSVASRHRPTKSMGPSILDKVVSKTRPNFLPPKPRKEDRKHMADWETMMKKSRVAEEKRRKALQDRRLARERQIEESMAIWEREIVPNWRVVFKEPALRKLWWQGVPTKLRGTMWQDAVGNALALSKDNFKACLSRAKRALSSGSFPTTVLGLIDDDIKTTFPSLHLFVPEIGPLYQDLKDMLCAWVVARSDEGLGYVPGVAKIAAMLLINMAPAQGFLVMRNLLERHCMRSFYGGFASKDDVEAYYRIFDTLLADGMPKIYFNFKQHQISPASYLPDWLIPLFLDHLPFEACARLWDIILLEGDPFLYRAALGILAVLEPRLFFPDKQELLDLLKGENKAALEVAKRDGRPLNGGKYEIYGVDEETLWERLDDMEDWWKESTWRRLIQRELPDL